MGFHLFPTTKMTRRGYARLRLGYWKYSRTLGVRVRNEVRLRVGVRIKVGAKVLFRFRVRLGAFSVQSVAKRRTFSRRNMTSCHFGSWKLVKTCLRESHIEGRRLKNSGVYSTTQAKLCFKIVLGQCTGSRCVIILNNDVLFRYIMFCTRVQYT